MGIKAEVRIKSGDANAEEKVKILFQDMIERWPSSLVARSQLSKFTGGLLSQRYMANLDSLGIGIKDRIRCGRQIAYPVRSVVEFLESRTQRA
jgi:hypothetical protein